MKADELKKVLGVSDATIEESTDFNPLRVVLTEEFNKIEKNQTKDYRNRALDRVINAKVDFVSETNSLLDLVQRCVKVINPLNGNEMKLKRAGGNSDEMTITFQDPETKDKIIISFANDAIGFEPNKEK